jgi:hypothetical protein
MAAILGSARAPGNEPFHWIGYAPGELGAMFRKVGIDAVNNCRMANVTPCNASAASPVLLTAGMVKAYVGCLRLAAK